MSRFRKKLSLFYNLLINCPKRWRFPQKSDVLLYDGAGMEALMPYLKGYSLYVHYIRGEEVNVPCVAMSLFDKYFWRGKLFSAYLCQVIKRVAPKVVLTCNDNDRNFYRIAFDHQGLSTMFIQNGWRYGGHIFPSLIRGEKYRVDYMLVFNRAIAAKYREYLQGETLIAGSLKNNHYEEGFGEEAEVSGTVLFVSHYREKKGQILNVDAQGRPLYWDDVYRFDVQLLQWLNTWCSEHDRKLLVCAKNYSGEESWYESILGRCGCSWEYLPRNSIYDCYSTLQRAEIVVTIDSTLGFEAFGRGKKTAFLAGRGQWISDKTRIFPWPAELPDSGPFWSNNPDKSEFLRIMDYLSSVSDEEWQLLHKQYRDDVMAYDPGNTILQKLLDKLLPKSATAMEG